MSFWTSPELEPTRKYRFQIQTPGSTALGGNWWWAKSVDKPSFEINTSDYQLTNHKFKFPGILTWNDISITIVDTGGRAKALMNNLSRVYKNPLQSADIHGSTYG